MRRATLKSRAASATDEPPYFWTTSPPLIEASAPEGYIYSDSSCRHRTVLVDQAAEQFPPLHLGHDLHRLDMALPIRCPKVDVAVGSRSVVVTSVARKDAVQMTATEEQRPVEDLMV